MPVSRRSESAVSWGFSVLHEKPQDILDLVPLKVLSNQRVDSVVSENNPSLHKKSSRVRNELLAALDFTDINSRKKEQQELLYLLCKRGVQKDLIDDYYEYKQSVNQYTVGALLLTDSVTNLVRKELRKLKTVKVTADEIRELLKNEVIK